MPSSFLLNTIKYQYLVGCHLRVFCFFIPLLRVLYFTTLNVVALCLFVNINNLHEQGFPIFQCGPSLKILLSSTETLTRPSYGAASFVENIVTTEAMP